MSNTRAVSYELSTAPPSLNNAFPTSKNSHRYASAAYKKWKSGAGWEIKAQGIKHISGDFEVVISIGAKASRADLDNLIKPVVDLLVSMKITDDDAKMQLVTIRRTAKHDGVKVWVFRMGKTK